MIEANEIFSDFDSRLALWCPDLSDTNDMAALANYVVENQIPLISLSSSILSYMWTCLEKTKVKIFTRYVFSPLNKNIDNDVSKLSEQIIADYKKGTDGVQIFVKMRDFEHFVDLVSVIRDDLFFEHDLCLVMDIEGINIDDWETVFQKLHDIKANAFGISFDEDMGNRSDFIGRIYSMLQNWNFEGDLHFMLKNNYERIDQAMRLVESLRPELSDRLHFFVEY